jgi:cobalt-zinc-cadmium efflux system membrane fusion protein
MIRLLVAFLVGAAVAVATVGGLPSLRGAAKPLPESANADKSDADDNLVKLTSEQIAAANITVTQVDKAEVVQRILVPATIAPHADRVARVSVKLTATVAELRKKVGDLVDKGEVLAVLESREVADAKSEFLAARLTNDLEQDLHQRDKVLWQSKFATEQQYLRSRTTAARAKVALDIARQKLIALGLGESEIAALPDQPEASLRFQPVISPIAGRVVERRVELGQALGRDNLETELFTVADLSSVWIDMAVSASDLPAIVLGQRVTITRRNWPETSEGRVIFVSPMLDKETRTARVVAELDNHAGIWRPGLFVTAAIVSDARPVPLAVPVSAVQSISGQRVVFVRTADGFEKRSISIGHSDDQIAEVTDGLQPAEKIATSNTFLLKSELLKGGVED